jgi:hypothetical protein
MAEKKLSFELRRIWRMIRIVTFRKGKDLASQSPSKCAEDENENEGLKTNKLRNDSRSDICLVTL